MKNILSNFVNKKIRSKTRNGLNSAQKPDLGFPIIKTAFADNILYTHLFIVSFMTKYVLNHINFIYGIGWRTNVTKNAVFRPLIA